jgi:glyoxylase-like metal-dependent hydrolase (beta-lactamase superfamily II)
MLRENVVEGIHMVDDAYVNWFLVEEGRKLTVVDSGHPSSWKSLQRALSKLGRSVGDIEAVVLTHGHFDHMGFARRAHEELGVPVWAHERETAVPGTRGATTMSAAASRTSRGIPVSSGSSPRWAPPGLCG